MSEFDLELFGPSIEEVTELYSHSLNRESHNLAAERALEIGQFTNKYIDYDLNFANQGVEWLEQEWGRTKHEPGAFNQTELVNQSLQTYVYLSFFKHAGLEVVGLPEHTPFFPDNDIAVASESALVSGDYTPVNLQLTPGGLAALRVEESMTSRDEHVIASEALAVFGLVLRQNSAGGVGVIDRQRKQAAKLLIDRRR